MNHRIWKYELCFTGIQLVGMPEGAEILSVAIQNGILCIWAMVDPGKGTAMRRIEIIGTGDDVYQDTVVERKFIGTVLTDPFVWHVFERTN